MKVNCAEKLTKLRQLISYNGFQGFIFSTMDEYMSKYPPQYAKRIEYITGFTGSLAVCIVLKDTAAIFVDGRYTLQAKNQIDGSYFEVHDYSLFSIEKFLQNYIKATSNIAINIKTTSINELDGYQKICDVNGYELALIQEHLVDEIWDNQPESPMGNIYIYPEKFGSQPYQEKIEVVASLLKQHNIDYYLVTDVENIAWLLNLRGSDVDCNPVFFSTLVIDSMGEVGLFVNKNKMNTQVLEYLSCIKILEEKEIESYLAKVIDKNKLIALSNNTPAYYVYYLKNQGYNYQISDDFCSVLKTSKNKQEIESTMQAHLRESLYITKTLYNVHSNPEKYSEVSLDEELNSFRQKDNLFVTTSFSSIVGVDDHGAIVHYRATRDSNKIINPQGYMLLDCGSQYMDGTTDMTRSISFHKQSDEYKHSFTLVLKGHIALAHLVFKQGTGACHIESLARQYLWKEGKDYDHSTGHGVGFFLCVHEGPASMSRASSVPLQAGMIISNEPGYYVEGQYGIRLENLYVVEQADYDGYLRFKVLTMVPFDVKNIDFGLLNKTELAWLNNYHDKVYNNLYDKLDDKEKLWLKSYMGI